MDTSKVNRFEVIDHSKEFKGRFVIERGKRVSLSLQDGGKTLKVFLKDKVENNISLTRKPQSEEMVTVYTMPDMLNLSPFGDNYMVSHSIPKSKAIELELI